MRTGDCLPCSFGRSLFRAEGVDARTAAGLGRSMASLFVIQGRDQGKRFELHEAVLGVGREPEPHPTARFGGLPAACRRSSRRRTAGSWSTWTARTARSSTASGSSSTCCGAAIGSSSAAPCWSSPATKTSRRSIWPTRWRSSTAHRRAKAHASSRSVSQEEGSRMWAGRSSPASPWLARARSNLQVMYRTALAVSHTLDIDQLLQRIMELIFEWVEADRGCIMLADRETERTDAAGLPPPPGAPPASRPRNCRSARRSWTT